jgi:hypothetical protein
MIDLFGNDTPITESSKVGKLSKYQLFKLRYKYRKAETKDKRCFSCANHQLYEYHDKLYHKCSLMGESHSAATDIRISNVCAQFKEETK